MKIIIILSITIVLLLLILARTIWSCRKMQTKKDLSIISRFNEQERLKKELETIQIEKQVVERILESKLEVFVLRVEKK